MKKLKWILPALAVLAVIVMTLPQNLFCEHTFVHKKGTWNHQCTKCGTVAAHTYEVISCTRSVCTVCGYEGSASNHNYEKIPCTNQKRCTICHAVSESVTVSHNRVPVMNGCTTTYICSDCGKQVGSSTSHKWVSDNCEEGFSCKLCGATDYPSHMQGHSYTVLSTFFSLPMFCRYCGKWDFPPLTFGAACVYFGLVMCIAAFIFLLVNRKRIRIREGRFFRTMTPESQLREKGTEEEYS